MSEDVSEVWVVTKTWGAYESEETALVCALASKPTNCDALALDAEWLCDAVWSLHEGDGYVMLRTREDEFVVDISRTELRL